MAQLALEEAAVATRVAPAAAAGAEAATGATAVGEAATGAAAAEASWLASIAFWGLVLLLPFTLASDSPVPHVEPLPQPEPQPEPPAEPEPRRRRRRRPCGSDPCPEPLPIHWPEELPLPDDADDLARTPASVREAEGVGDRGRAQARLHEEIVRARQQGVPPPSPCDPDVEWDPYRWNAPFDAHHKHPLYLGGVDAAANLCALEADLHQRGHPRLDDQTDFLPVYEQCGICSGRLSLHPEYQYYVIVGTK